MPTGNSSPFSLPRRKLLGLCVGITLCVGVRACVCLWCVCHCVWLTSMHSVTDSESVLNPNGLYETGFESLSIHYVFLARGPKKSVRFSSVLRFPTQFGFRRARPCHIFCSLVWVQIGMGDDLRFFFFEKFLNGAQK